MIELRWLIENGGLTKVLQYRLEKSVVTPYGYIYNFQWSDWQDVPTVEGTDGQ